jgi:zinc transporter 1/2/3
MSLLDFKIFAAFALIAITLAGGWYPLSARFKKTIKEDFGLAEALTSGVFLGAALFHLLPDSIRQFHEIYGNFNYPYPFLLCAFGFVLLLFLEKIILHLADENPILSQNLIPFLLTMVISVHEFIAGAAIGVNLYFASTLIIFLAILAHKAFESFSLASVLGKSSLSSKKIIILFSIFTLITPLGILLGTLVSEVLQAQTAVLTEAIFNAVAAGTFLYIATLHNTHMHAHEHHHHPLLEPVMVILGVSLMAVVAIWV